MSFVIMLYTYRPIDSEEEYQTCAPSDWNYHRPQGIACSEDLAEVVRSVCHQLGTGYAGTNRKKRQPGTCYCIN